MTRREYIRLEVLNSICDGGENVDQWILPMVNADAGKTGITIRRTEVVEALTELVEGGLAKAWHLSPRPSNEGPPLRPFMAAP